MSQQLEEHFKIGVKCCLNAFVKDINVQGTYIKDFFFQFFFGLVLLKSILYLTKMTLLFQKKNCPTHSERLNVPLYTKVRNLWICYQKAEEKVPIVLLQFTKKVV